MPQAGQGQATGTDKPINNVRKTCLKQVINELNIMVEDIDPHIIGITESWANTDITHADLALTVYVMFRRERIGRRGGGVILC